MTHLVGQQLGRYLVQEEIGRGGMARVYRALDTQLKRTVALKVLAPQLAVDPEFAQRFEREAVTAANLRHPNIVTIYDVGEHNNLRYIAMEYVRGRTLHAIIEERGALGLGYAIAIVGPVAAALDYAHSQGAVHRDVKPQNVLIDIEGRVLLTDFGIAQAPEGGGDSKRLTRTGIFMGTPEYISPEQASAQRVDGRSDLYSLGIATYEIITGTVPFSGATPQLIVAHAQKAPPAPSSIDPRQPPELDMVLGRILAKRPEHRFATGAAFVEGLRVVARKYTTPPVGVADLADLAVPHNSSAGQSTVALGHGQTPAGRQPPVLPPRPAAPIDPAEPTHVGTMMPGQQQAAADAPTRATPAAPPPRAVPAAAVRTPEVPAYAARPAAPNAAAIPGRRSGTPSSSWIVAGVLGGLFLILIVVLSRTFNPSASPPFAPTGQPPATLQPTVAPTEPPSETPVPTDIPTTEPATEPAEATAAPRPTERPVPPTAVPEPPTDIPEPPTAVPEPPTDIPEPPTAVPEPPTEVISPTIEPLSPTATSPPEATVPPEATAAPSATIAGSPSPLASATATVSLAPTTTLTPTQVPTAEASPTTAPTPPPDTATPTPDPTPG